MSNRNNIAIFSSQRIDLNCPSPRSSIYHPVRCGAIFDKSTSSIPGDDTGDNISHKRNEYCELTVQYWAWKNYDSDYYGLCHYRRYFSLSDEIFETHRFNVVENCDIVSASKKYELNNERKIKRILTEYEGIIPCMVDVTTIPVYNTNTKKTIYPQNVLEFWKGKPDQIDEKCIDALKSAIENIRPDMVKEFEEYLSSRFACVGCCFVLKRDLFYELCEFQFPILEELERIYDMKSYSGEYATQLNRQPGFMGELLYGTFLNYILKTHRLKELQVVFFSSYSVDNIGKEIPRCVYPNKFKFFIKKIMSSILPAYRVSIRVENEIENVNQRTIRLEKKLAATYKAVERIDKYVAREKLDWVNPSVNNRTNWERYTLTASKELNLACFAQEVHETHKKSFAEFKNCNTGKDVVIVATGPSSTYYKQLKNKVHIGVNAAFNIKDIELDYYFTTDFESRNEWFEQLKEYDFIKFFGQYSSGVYRDRFQVSEKLIIENNARKFFQGAPSEDIHLNIEFYPLMGFYSVTFQAIHFALYTNPKSIYLVGCDCNNNGYYNGDEQLYANLQEWNKGYYALREFAERFYPDMTIYSINPVGLKGVFEDVYTEEFLLAHPELQNVTLIK